MTSEREFIAKSIQHAKDMVDGGNGKQMMPLALLPESWTTPTTAYRWHSLAAPGYVCGY